LYYLFPEEAMPFPMTKRLIFLFSQLILGSILGTISFLLWRNRQDAGLNLYIMAAFWLTWGSFFFKNSAFKP